MKALPLMGLLTALALLAGACAQRDEARVPDPAGVVALPEWVSRVYPEPGAQVAGAANVQVEHALSEPDEGIRLSVDGTDVTIYAQEGRGLLSYDPDREPTTPPVELDPGDHRATVERLALDPQTGEIEDTVETFTWDFTIQ